MSNVAGGFLKEITAYLTQAPGVSPAFCGNPVPPLFLFFVFCFFVFRLRSMSCVRSVASV